MAKMKKGFRAEPESMKSLAFDLYIYSGGHYADAGEHSGVVICRQSKELCRFGSYHREKANILQFIDKQYEKKLMSWAKMANLRKRLYLANKKLSKLKVGK